MKNLVCKKLCTFYKPGNKEDMKCGSVQFLSRNLTKGELAWLVEHTPEGLDLSADEEVRSMVCEKTCEYYTTSDCDFRLGNQSPPCGGYAVIARLLKETDGIAHA